jgi:hypothetical protein
VQQTSSAGDVRFPGTREGKQNASRVIWRRNPPRRELHARRKVLASANSKLLENFFLQLLSNFVVYQVE